MRRAILAALFSLVVTAAAAPARAQFVVTDPGAYARMLSQIREAQNQLAELQTQVRQGTEMIGQGQRLYDSLNQLSNVNSIGAALNAPALRSLLPRETGDADRMMSGALQDLGALSARATAIRNASRVYNPAEPATTDAERYYRAALESAGARAARDMAMGERVNQAADGRLQGLEELRQALGAAPNARAVMDLQARISAETAMIQNDQMRLQGVAMMQAAQDRLERQKDREEQAMRHSRAQEWWRSLYR